MNMRYARQYTLAEIGTTGQARLEAARVRAGEGDARASAVALDYLSRAGVGTGGDAIEVASSEEITRISGRPELIEAAAFLVGALAATDAIAKIAGAPARPVAHLPTLTG